MCFYATFSFKFSSGKTAMQKNGMKNIFFLLVIFCQTVGYGQFDSLKIALSRQYGSPDYSKTIYPKNDGLTYNQFVGETIAGYHLANGWRKDTINGGFNKEIYRNPYVVSNGDYILLKKESYDKNFIFYKYVKGKKYSGTIIDTLDLTYTPPVIRGIVSGNPYYESKNIKVIFQADCVEGLLQGKGIITKLNTKEIVSECYFKNGEIIGKSVSKGIYTNNTFTITYEKGSDKPLNQKETDKEKQEVIAKNPKDELSFKTAYFNLTDPNQLLEKKERTEQEYNRAVQSLINGSFLKNPLQLALHHINTANSQKPIKEYETELLKIKEILYEDLKIVFYNFKNSPQKDAVTVTECYDANNHLILVFYQNVLSDEINSLNYRDYNSFFSQFISFNEFNRGDYGNFLVTFKFDKKNNIIMSSKFSFFSQSYANESSQGWIYNNFTNKIKKHPIAILKQE